MSKQSKKKKLLIALFVIMCLFIMSLKNNTLKKVEAAEEENFKAKYYKNQVLTQEVETPFYLANTIPLELNLESYSGEEADFYKLNANQPLSYIKIELSPDLYAILYKESYSNNGIEDFRWNMEAKYSWITLINVDIFLNKNEYSLCFDDSSIIISKNEESSEFLISMTGSVAEKVRKQKSVPLLVRDDAGNEIKEEFKIPAIIQKQTALLDLKEYIVKENGIYAEYNLKNNQGELIDLENLIEIKRRLKDSTSSETVQDFILSIDDKGDFVYHILFEDIEYTAEVSNKGALNVPVHKTGNLKEFLGKLYFEYASSDLDFTNITLYEFGENSHTEYLINTPNLYFEQEKQGLFTYYFQKAKEWHKFTINFEEEVIPAPTMKSFSFDQKVPQQIILETLPYKLLHLKMIK